MTNLVATYAPSTTRSDNLQDAGFKFTFTGASGSLITQLGIWKTTGNTGNWTVSVRNASNTQIIASATINMTAATVGQFNYAAAVIPVGAKGALASSATTAAIYYLVVNIPVGQSFPDTTPVTLNNATTAVGVFQVPDAVGGGLGGASGSGNQYAGVDLVFIAPAASGPGNLVAAYDPGTNRVDDQRDVGFKFVYTGTTGWLATQLGAWKISGNTGNWVVSLRNSTNTIILASATIAMAGGVTARFNYASCTPFALVNGTIYFLVVNVPVGQAWADLAAMAINSGSTVIGVFQVADTVGGGVGSTNGTDVQYVGADMVFGPPAPVYAQSQFFL